MYTKLLILASLYSSRGLFMNECFPKVRRVSEKQPRQPQPHRQKKQNMKIYIIDIDGTICDTKNSDYYNSIPKNENIRVFNEIYDSGNEVHYWTARGEISGKNWDEYTVQQLNEWGVKYTSINMGKPHYDVWIDDKAINLDFLQTRLSGYDGN